MRDSSGHFPAAASPSEHSGTPARAASIPGGSRIVSRDSRSWPWARVTPTPNGATAPACAFVVPAWKPRLNGVGAQVAPWPSLSTANVVLGVAAGCPLYGVITAVLVAGPQASGVASVAPGPRSNESVKSVNGNCGVSAKVAVSRPVSGSGCTDPTSRTESPKPWTSTNSRNGSSAAGDPRYTEPARAGAGSTGVAIDASPSLDAAGHAMGRWVPRANWLSVHAARPFAAAGLIVMPCGSVTDTSFTWAVASVSASPLCGTCRSIAALVGASACVVPGVNEIDGSNGNASQPSAPTGVVDVALSSFPFHEDTVSVVVCAPEHAVGRLRNAVFVRSTAVPPPVHVAPTQVCPRSASCPASDGTPQKVRVVLLIPDRTPRFGALEIVKNRPASPVSRTPPMMSIRGSSAGAKSDRPSAVTML